MEKLKILVAIDDPDLAKIILETTCNIIDKNNSEITLLNVLETSLAEDEYFYREPQKFIEHEAEKSDFALLENYLEDEGFNYKGFIYKEGDAADNILNIAANENFDLIAIGSHNKHEIERIFLGSVSYKVTRHSRCSVLVIKPAHLPKTDLNSNYTALFAVDGYDYSTYASNNLGKFLDTNSAEIIVLNVTVPMQEIIPADAYIYTDIARIIEESNLVADDIIRDAALNVAKQRLTIKRKYHTTGDPASTIMSEAENNEADLIIVGSHGKSTIADWLMGSVSTRVYEYSSLPVLIIKK